MCVEGYRVGELFRAGALKLRERRLRQAGPAHIVEGGGPDDAEARPRRQDRQKVRSDLDAPVRNAVKRSSPICRVYPSRHMPRRRIIDRDPERRTPKQIPGG